MRKIVLAALVLVFLAAPALAQEGVPASWTVTKNVLQSIVYADHRTTFYCGCTFEENGDRAGTIDLNSCGYRPRSNGGRANRMEVEHVLPISWVGYSESCWTDGHPDCVDTKGESYAGRRCCYKVSENFRTAHNDLHNLVPSVGEINGDRSYYPYGLVDGEIRNYGSCDFEVDRRTNTVEPAEPIRGDAARMSLYMIDRYGASVSAEFYQLMTDWDRLDPPDEWEFERNERISNVQGNGNPWVERWKDYLKEPAAAK